MAVAGLRKGYMFQRRFWKNYAFVTALCFAALAGKWLQEEVDKGLASYKHKSMLFKDVKIPPGEDFWKR